MPRHRRNKARTLGLHRLQKSRPGELVYPEVYVDLLNWVLHWYHESVTTVPHITGFSKEVDAEMNKLIYSDVKDKAHLAWVIGCSKDLDRLHKKYK